MTTDLETLGKRAVACRHWRWLGGALRIVPAPHEGATGYTIRVPQDGYREAPGEYPDLSDPATLGCLLALVREAWKDPTLGLFAARGGRAGRPATVWALHGRKPHRRGFDTSLASAFFQSEAVALVFALEAAP